MKNNTKRTLISRVRSLSSKDLLEEKLSVIEGLDDAAVKAMGELQIFTVFDLATSPIFNAARNISARSDKNATPVSLRGKAASHMVATRARDKDIDELREDSISNLDGIGGKLSDIVRDSTEIATIRDMAAWPAFETARDILNDALGNSFDRDQQDTFDTLNDLPDDPDAPRALLPRIGDYPTEKTHYQRIFLDKIQPTKEKLIPIEGAIDILSLNLEAEFQSPATGAMLTFEQAWYGEGLALGQLLHSLTLAPGESTKVAVIDWSRQSSTRVGESISQREILDNQLTQNRSVHEIMSGVTKEIQSGKSEVTSTATAGSGGSSSGAIESFFSGSETGGYSYNDSNVISVSSSEGNRDVSADTTQQIASSTHQHAAAARNRRASIVRDASQEEHEEVRTRVITNYNHSHALSVHYYEVVQIYKTVTRLARAERCLFVPLKILNFQNEKIIDRYRQDLLNASLNDVTTDLLHQATGKVVFKRVLTSNSPGAGSRWSVDADIRLYEIRVQNGWRAIRRVNIILKDASADPIPVEVDDASSFEVTGKPSADTISAIQLEIEVGDSEIRQMPASLFLIFQNESRKRGFRVRFDLDFSQPGPHQVELLKAAPPVQNRELSQLLEEEALYYSQAVWLNLKQHEVAMLLSNRTYKNKRIIEYIDPLPLTIYGNYLVLRFNLGADPQVERDSDWEAWKAKHANFRRTQQELIPTPSGGVFGEAVLGRFNASEKLDPTRFWNWQDSPIPDSAPEISPVGTGSRGIEDPILPGRLDAPVVSIQNAPSLPDPQGINAITQALIAANVFRDMSGLANAQQLAGQTAGLATQGAIAGQQAAVDLQKAQLNAISRIVETAITGKASSIKGAGVGTGNHSVDGAWVNFGKNMDHQAEASGGRAAGATSDHSGGDGTVNAVGGSGSHEEYAYRRAVDPQGSLIETFRSELGGAVADSSGSVAGRGIVLKDWKEYHRDLPVNDNTLEFYKWRKSSFYEKVSIKEVLLSHFVVDKADLLSIHEDKLNQLADEITHLLQMVERPITPMLAHLRHDGRPIVFRDRNISDYPDFIEQVMLEEGEPKNKAHLKLGLPHNGGEMTGASFLASSGFYLGYYDDNLTVRPIRIKIEGNASQTGPEANNANLSSDRFEEVRAHLVGKGVPEHLIEFGGAYGSNQPIVDNDNIEEDLNRNTRIEIEYSERYSLIPTLEDLQQEAAREFQEVKAIFDNNTDEPVARKKLKNWLRHNYDVVLPTGRVPFFGFAYEKTAEAQLAGARRFIKHKFVLGSFCHKLLWEVPHTEFLLDRNLWDEPLHWVPDNLGSVGQKYPLSFKEVFFNNDVLDANTDPMTRHKKAFEDQNKLYTELHSKLNFQVANHKPEFLAIVQEEARTNIFYRYSYAYKEIDHAATFRVWAEKYFDLSPLSIPDLNPPFYVEDLDIYRKANEVEQGIFGTVVPLEPD